MSVEMAHAVLGLILNQIPDDGSVHSWEIADNYIGGQVLAEDLGPGGVRRELDRLAHLIGQMSDVQEQHHSSYVSMETVGTSGNVNIKLWAICRPRPESES